MNELAALPSEEDILRWAKAILPLKNTLLDDDARVLEDAFSNRLDPKFDSLADTEPTLPSAGLPVVQDNQNTQSPVSGFALPKELRRRSKSHLLFVRE